MKEVQKIKFDCNGNNAPAYGCDKPGDNSGVYVQSTDYDELLRERNELSAQVERLRGAANKLSFGLVHDEPEWSPSTYTDRAFSELQDMLLETPAKSLDAVKREVAILTLEDYDAALSSFEMTVPEYIKARLS